MIRTKPFAKPYTLAAEQGIKIALSNEVFELWLLLHFMDVDPNVPLSWAEIYEPLQQEIRTATANPGYVYDHYHHAADVVSLITVHGDLDAAILRAQQLKEHFAETDLLGEQKGLAENFTSPSRPLTFRT